MVADLERLDGVLAYYQDGGIAACIASPGRWRSILGEYIATRGHDDQVTTASLA